MIVIGAGAAGLCAAITAGRAGQKVLLLEKNSKVGRKILVSGNGKCNITNRFIAPYRFHSNDPQFVEKVLEGYGFDTVAHFFNTLGLELVEGKEGKMFPMSMQASSVAEIMEYEARRAGVQIVCDCAVTRIEYEGGRFRLETSQGMKECRKLLIASGSPAAPQLGGNDSGYAFALKLGHSLIPRHPSLVQLCSEDSWVKGCAGVKIAGKATLYANGEQIIQKEGDLLFTSYGISGLAILDLSREASVRLAQFDYCELSLDLIPTLSKERLTRLLLNRIDRKSQKPVGLWLQGVLHKKLVKIILKESRCKSRTEGELDRKEVNRLVHSIKNLRLGISGTKGFQGAEVATGGIDTHEVDPETMASKRVPELYFAGEILDVDGERGGCNFHFAWVGGLRAGYALSREAR
jgi:predicted Rossmann fold flavoprotein